MRSSGSSGHVRWQRSADGETREYPYADLAPPICLVARADASIQSGFIGRAASVKGNMGDMEVSAAVLDLLAQWRNGDPDALPRLLPLLYQELRSIARRHLRAERAGHTLESRALVHEAYLRLFKGGPVDAENRSHFLGIVSRVMRQVLVDHARQQLAAKRDGGCRVELETALELPAAKDVDVIAVDDALTTLATLDARQSEIVELRFFGGLSIEDTATAVGLSPATVKREWVTARAWLSRELDRNTVA